MRLKSRSAVSGIMAALVAVGAWPLLAHHTPPPNRFEDTLRDVQGVVKEVR